MNASMTGKNHFVEQLGGGFVLINEKLFLKCSDAISKSFNFIREGKTNSWWNLKTVSIVLWKKISRGVF